MVLECRHIKGQGVASLTAVRLIVVALEAVLVVLIVGLRERLSLVLHASVLEPDLNLPEGKQRNTNGGVKKCN